ncbi:gamma-glutamyltransferase [Sphingopyxis panaciterrulae]|uniref:Glutathione hydrolase proenzyme n=1 Tax=Sphingopyxis panaciterrulae TaxID=462372 RepID=A0A7W9ET23_9SPHN|nr:gamma-glutamyltransferase [Sphingopyxis panaciterrulae]MBB5707536.1 gamma-glutamyltranspeptidase/glutathione hydrolase [Sphingopyxis panaciterrulae]
MIKRLFAVFSLLVIALPSLAAAQGVTSSADPRATEAGREILMKGGSAADAEMAMMLALTLVEPQSSGVGGGGFFVYHDAKTGKISTIDGRETAPAAATPDRFLDANGQPRGFMDVVPGGLSVGVPGNIRLMEAVHERWGKLPWADIFQPAIDLAEKGYEATPALVNFMTAYADVWKDFPEIRAIYYVDGKPAPVGTIIRNPAYAKLLRDLAARGADAFYTGANAQAIVKAVTQAPRNRSKMTLADLAAYQAKERPAVCTTYRVYKVCGMAPPSSGATTVFGILGMLEAYDMKAMGKDNVMGWHLLAEAMQLAYADRAQYLGDSDFVDVPVKGLLDKQYLASRRMLISPFTVRSDYPAGSPPGAEPRTASGPVAEHGTTHFVAVDRDGNVASMTSTVESIFGSQLVANGYVLNNELTDFTFVPERDGKPVANRVEANKRPLSSMSPTIVYGPDGKVILALGSAGGKRIIMHVAKTLVGVLDWGLSAKEAIALPNLFFDDAGAIIENDAMGRKLAQESAVFGNPFRAEDFGSKVNAVERIATGWRGAADPRSPGTWTTDQPAAAAAE